MTRFDIFDTIERLRREGTPFCIATVVRTADVTSAKAGAKAAVTAEGEILGHLGGACVSRAVKTASGQALETGQTRVICVKPTGEIAPADNVQLFNSGCPSGGTVDILIEAYTLPPALAVIGDTPIARAVAAHARLMGFRLQTVEGVAPGPLALEPRDFVVIASQGAGDGQALETALASEAAHIALVASRKKAETLIDRLGKKGIAESDLERIKAPAGLDLGGVDPHEIAIAILGEIVQWRHRKPVHP